VKTRTSRFRTWTKGLRPRTKWSGALVVLVLLLVAARAYAPIAVQRYVNRVLDRAEGYHGRIGDVDLNLYRGAYQIENVEILKSDGRVPVPLLRSPLVDLSVEWRALFEGSVVGEMWLEDAELNFVSGPRSQRQSGVETDWRDVVRDLFPVKINRVTVRNGSIHWRNFASDPPFDVFLRDVDLVARNLTNSADLREERVASLDFTATPMNAGRVEIQASIDPYADLPTFNLDGKVSGVALEHFNRLFRAYAGVDVERGRLRLFTELESKEGSFHGYVKPFFEDVDVLGAEEVTKQNFFYSLWEAIVGTTAEALEDQDEDRVATRIPISGRVDSPDIGFFRTLGNVLRNAFVDAFIPELDNSVGKKG
jgi:Domain of Unknown Function (DUF748)